jgi:excisionase family DNA binding protein
LADYLKIPEVARRLDVSEPTVRRMVKGGKLPSVFIGGAYRVSEQDLDEYLESARVTPGKGTAPLSQGTLFNGPTATKLPGLKAARERRGMGVNELAARAGLAAAEVAILDGGGQLPDPIRIEPLADVLGCFSAELLFPHDQYEAFLAEAEHPAIVEEDLSKLSPETVLAMSRAQELMRRGYDKNDEQRARERPEAG